MTQPCPQSPAGMPCIFALHRVGIERRNYLACMLCGAPKSQEKSPRDSGESCYFADAGDAARRAMEGAR